MTLEALARALAAHPHRPAPVERIAREHLPAGGFGVAAVLVPLHEEGGVTSVLLTLRRHDLKHHAGQVSFPGGRVEPGEAPLAAALREAQEEIGLDPGRARVLGRLSETVVLQSAFRLTPWVASVPYPYPYAAAPREVEAIWHVPLPALMAPGVHRTERRLAYGLEVDVHHYDVEGRTIWGATARVLSELLRDLERHVKIFPVIMAGGSGTRFWPLSRRSRPKQFLALAGDVPLLAATVRRLPPLARPVDTYVVCGPAHAAAAKRLVRELPAANFIVEPCARNTAPCVGLAALHVAARDKKGVVLMLPADHHIARPEAFREALAAAARLAEAGHIATIGIRPHAPETGYGYLKVGPRLPGKGKKGASAHRVERFVEKPDVVTAARYLADGSYLWNSGIFAFRADVILEEIRRAMPVLGEQLGAIQKDLGTPAYKKTLARVFPDCPSISIDYGVMEKSQRIVVVPADFGWSDVGSFAALPEVRETDHLGNVAEGDALVIDGRNNVVLAGKDRPVAVIGLDDVVVVDAGDAILVCRKDRAQDVRKAVDELARRGRDEVL